MAERITRDRFLEKWYPSSNGGDRYLRDGYVALECKCGEYYCEGWTMTRITDLGIGLYGGTEETIADALAHRAVYLETHPAPETEEDSHAG